MTAVPQLVTCNWNFWAARTDTLFTSEIRCLWYTSTCFLYVAKFSKGRHNNRHTETRWGLVGRNITRGNWMVSHYVCNRISSRFVLSLWCFNSWMLNLHLIFLAAENSVKNGPVQPDPRPNYRKMVSFRIVNNLVAGIESLRLLEPFWPENAYGWLFLSLDFERFGG